MISFEEAARMLDEAAEALPEEVFKSLNGGVNLLPASKTDENGLLIMGTYFRNQMGRYIEIYYGSCCATLANAEPERWRRELAKTLKHELTHHIENLAGDRSLEDWDDQHKEKLLAELYFEPLDAESILFIDENDSELAPVADGLFRRAAEDEGLPVRSASAGLSLDPPAAVYPHAVAAAAVYGADISAHRPTAATLELMLGFDAVICMTVSQYRRISADHPQLGDRIMCLGETDLLPPVFNSAGGWRRAAQKLALELEYLLDDLLQAGKGQK